MGYAASMRSPRQAEVGGAVDWGERRGCLHKGLLKV